VRVSYDVFSKAIVAGFEFKNAYPADRKIGENEEMRFIASTNVFSHI